MLIFDDEDELPLIPNEAEARLAVEIGEEGLAKIDALLLEHTPSRSRKGARVVLDAINAQGLSLDDDARIHLYARRLLVLVDAGLLEGAGDLHRPRWSEVRRPVCIASEPEHNP